jgi:DNA-binding response OmpR family regulator
MTKEQSPAELLTAGLIHEIRHPLMGIKLGLQLIQRAVGDELSRQVEWPMVLSQVARLEELLKSYQRFLTPDEAGPGEFELGPVLQQAIDLCMIRLKKLGDRFTYHPGPGGVYVLGTPDALMHALTNVLFNALDAVDQQGTTGRIEVRAIPSAKNDGSIEIRVSDEGSGIAPKIAERIFEPRFTTKPRDKGSGLGLSIARRMMQANGGEVALVDGADLFRQPWATTEFKITLWAKVPAAPSAAPEPAAAPATDAAAAIPKDARRAVLLIEDDKVICGMLARGVELSGYRVTTAGTAEDAIALLGTERFDAVVTDKNLPGKSGEDVARAVREQSLETALVMMTGYASRDSAAEMQRLSADAYLTKPFEIPDLTRVLGQVIGRRMGQVTMLEQIKAKPPAPPIHLIAVVEPDKTDSVRLVTLLLEQKLKPMVREDVLAALDESPPPDALIVNSSCLTEPVKQRLLNLQLARPELRVVVISPSDGLADLVSAIQLNAAAQLVQPWTDEVAAKALRRALDPKEVLR